MHALTCKIRAYFHEQMTREKEGFVDSIEAGVSQKIIAKDFGLHKSSHAYCIKVKLRKFNT